MTDLLDDLAARVTALGVARPIRVGIDGRSAAGKTTFAARLAAALEERGRPVVPVSVDDFHTPGHKWRSAAGEYTAEGYYRTAYDLDRFRRVVLDPLGPGGDRRIVPKHWSAFEDVAYVEEALAVPSDAVVVVEGLFLFRAELADAWDFTIWLDIPFAVMVARAMERDVAWVGDADVVRARYLDRYVPLHVLYEEETGAPDRADVVIENSEPLRPRLLRSRSRP